MTDEQYRQLWKHIPEELRQFRQWCVCGPEFDRDHPKRPFNPLTRRPASSVNPDSWVTFEEAMQAGASNVGFVLSKDDPFFVVDLDTYKSQVPQNHELILGAIKTYAEVSQSGGGFHIIGKGSVGVGRNSRIHGIEIYDRDRFIIMTGNRINDHPIVSDQPFVDFMLRQLGLAANVESGHQYASQQSDENDEDLISRMEGAQNGAKFLALFKGNVRLENGKDGDGQLCPLPDAQRYESQSEADLALIEMLCFFTPDDEQVARVFLRSALGQREKARRRDYVSRTIRSARGMIANNEIPLLDFSRLRSGANSPAAQASGSPAATRKQPGAIITRVADVLAQPISWLWPNRIALGKVTVLAGHPGLGKSQLTAFIAANVTNGGGWPNSEGIAPKGAVLMLSCEDDIADTIRPRLEAAGADIANVHVIEGVNSVRGDRRVFNVKEDMPHLEAALDRIPGVKAVVIDPITAYLDGSDSHNTGDVRAALAPLQDLAMQRGIAVVVVSHLNKSGGQGRSVNAVTGSIAFVAAARGAFLVEKDADDPDMRLMLEIKNNLAKAEGLAFYIRERVLPSGIRAPYLEFQPGTVERTADEALSQSGSSKRGGSALDDAKRFIIERLRTGPVPAQEMFEQAKDEGIASKTLRKAREELGIFTRKETGGNGRSIWSLPLSEMRSNLP